MRNMLLIQREAYAMRVNQFKAGIILVMFLLSPWASLAVSANGQPGSVDVFYQGLAQDTITLTAGVTDTSQGLSMPRNVTFTSAHFTISINDADTTPGSVWLDIDQDGDEEWSFNGTGYGDLGHQNVWADNSSIEYTNTTNGAATTQDFLFPVGATMESFTFNTSFTPQVGGGLVPVGPIDDMVSGDFNNDSLSDVAILSNDNATTGIGSAVAYISYSQSTGLTNSSWIATCANATQLSVGDLNNDSYDDLAAFDIANDKACLHLTNATTGEFGPVNIIAITSNTIDAELGDLSGNGYADVISIHAGGTFSVREWDDRNNAYKSNNTVAVNANNSPMPGMLSDLIVGDFFGNGVTALTVDNMQYVTQIIWMMGGPVASQVSFDGLKDDTIMADVDNDGDLDFLTSNDQGHLFAINNGSTWHTSSANDLFDLDGATIGDHDNDGTPSVLMPRPGGSDNNPATLEGNLTVHEFNTSSINSTAATYYTPWTNPTEIMILDMDGDGVNEQIIIAGESTSRGVFISGWYDIALDADGNGQDELAVSGYAGDGTMGLPALVMVDTFGDVYQTMYPITNSWPYLPGDYGIEMYRTSLDLSSSGEGLFTLYGLDIGYDQDFRVDVNPSAIGNLTNLLNQKQTAGTGFIDVDFPFTSTKSGSFKIKTLVAPYIAGAPNLAIPPTPVLNLDLLTYERVMIDWQDITNFGDDLVEFQVFRTENGGVYDLDNPYDETPINMFLDNSLTYGATYEYSVRSLHTFGVTSNLSERLFVTIPFPAPPEVIDNISAQDTPDDLGGSLDVSWDAGNDTIDSYKIYIQDGEFSNISGMTASSTVTPEFLTTTLTTDTNGSALVDGVPYYVSVAGFDVHGNTTYEVQSIGPVYTRNDSLRTPILEIELSGSEADGDDLHIRADGAFSAVLTLTVDGFGLENENVWFEFSHSAFTQNYTGVTDASGQFTAVDVTSLTQMNSALNSAVGDITLTYGYEGTAGDELLQPVDSTMASQGVIGMLHASLSNPGDAQLDNMSEYSFTADLTADIAAQQFHLEGTVFSWELKSQLDDLIQSGEVELRGGSIELTGAASATDILHVWVKDPANWMYFDNESFEVGFIAYDDPNQEENETNETEENNTEVVEDWIPDSIGNLHIQCISVSYDYEEGGLDLPTACQIHNLNHFSVDLTISLSGQGTVIFTPDVTSVTIADNGSANVKFTVTRNGDASGYVPGELATAVTLSYSATNTSYGLQNSHDVDLPWTLLNPIEDNTGPGDNTGQTGDDPKESSSSVLFIGIAVVVLALIVAVGVILKRRGSDDFDFDEDDNEYFDYEEPAAKESPAIPSGRSLDDLKSEGATIGEEAPSERPGTDLINEFDGNEAYEETHEETYEESYHEESDDGISVDENGTEWYEDEVGVWWYREAGQDDWAEWQE